jgi:hypothetical protein
VVGAFAVFSDDLEVTLMKLAPRKNPMSSMSAGMIYTFFFRTREKLLNAF